MKNVTIHTLECVSTEDWSGADTCRLEISVDGDRETVFRRDLNDGNRWRLNKTFNFNRGVKVRLWDEDWSDSNDLMGEVEIGTDIRRGAIATFQRDGADYRLRYSVADAPGGDQPANPEAAALQAIEDFRRASGDGVWPHIPRARLAADMEDRVRNPFNVRQRSGPFCGPAAIVFELVRRAPDRYVDICRTLYETGAFRARTKEVRPDDDLRQSRIGGGMDTADWMLIGTLRDTENLLFDVQGRDQGTIRAQLAGITTLGEMEGWMSELLGCTTVECHSTYLYGEFEAMREARRAIRRGGVAFLMINSAMVGGDPLLQDLPTHFIAYLGGLDIDEGVWYLWDSGRIRFDCYTWGRKLRVDEGEERFEKWMWGAVVGW